MANGDLSRKHGLCLVPPEGVMMDDILLKIGEQIGVENIRAASKMSHKIVVFVSQTRLVDIVVQNGLFLGDDETFVPVSSMDTPATKIILSNVPPFLSNEPIQQMLGDYGTVVSRIITAKDGRTQLNISMTFKVAEHDYRIFAMTETLICYNCGAYGHTKYYCPGGKKETYAAAAADGLGHVTATTTGSLSNVTVEAAGKPKHVTTPVENELGHVNTDAGGGLGHVTAMAEPPLLTTAVSVDLANQPQIDKRHTLKCSGRIRDGVDSNQVETAEGLEPLEGFFSDDDKDMETASRRVLKRPSISNESNCKGSKVLVVQEDGGLDKPSHTERNGEALGDELPPIANVEGDETMDKNACMHETESLVIEDNSQLETYDGKKGKKTKTDSDKEEDSSVQCQQEESTTSDTKGGQGTQLQVNNTGVVPDEWSSSLSETSGSLQGDNKQNVIEKEEIVRFLNETFRQRKVQIKDYFPDIKVFIATAKHMIQRNDDSVELSEPQFQRLRKALTKANKELQEGVSF